MLWLYTFNCKLGRESQIKGYIKPGLLHTYIGKRNVEGGKKEI